MKENAVKHLLKTRLLILILVLAKCVALMAEEPKTSSCYLIGNSLTWDTVPPLLSGDVQWHVDCGVNLPFIYAHPDKPCVKESQFTHPIICGM